MDYRVVIKDKKNGHETLVIQASCAAEAESIVLKKYPNRTIFDICRAGDCNGKSSKYGDGDKD